MNLDAAIPPLLFIYAAAMVLMALSRPGRWISGVLVVAVALRFVAVSLRTNLGSDIETYTAVLTQCDLSWINGLEFFWQIACLPSQYTSSLLPWPFLWVGLLDCILFVVLVRVGGPSVAAFHDLIYLPSTSMGAIRQALAMKLLLIFLILLVQRGQVRWSSRLLWATPFIHLAAIVPLGIIKASTGHFLVRIFLVASLTIGVISLVDEALISKILFYLDFEGFRSTQDIIASWVKRVFVITSCAALVNAPLAHWLFYGLGLVFAAAEPWIPEFSVRIGAYFEQTEAILLAAPARSSVWTFTALWRPVVAVAYAFRFCANVLTLSQ